MADLIEDLLWSFYKKSFSVRDDGQFYFVESNKVELQFFVLAPFDPIQIVEGRTRPVLEDLAREYCAAKPKADLGGFQDYVHKFLHFWSASYTTGDLTAQPNLRIMRGLYLSHLSLDKTSRWAAVRHYALAVGEKAPVEVEHKESLAKPNGDPPSSFSGNRQKKPTKYGNPNAPGPAYSPKDQSPISEANPKLQNPNPSTQTPASNLSDNPPGHTNYSPNNPNPTSAGKESAQKSKSSSKAPAASPAKPQPGNRHHALMRQLQLFDDSYDILFVIPPEACEDPNTPEVLRITGQEEIQTTVSIN